VNVYPAKQKKSFFFLFILYASFPTKIEVLMVRKDRRKESTAPFA